MILDPVLIHGATWPSLARYCSCYCILPYRPISLLLLVANASTCRSTCASITSLLTLTVALLSYSTPPFPHSPPAAVIAIAATAATASAALLFCDCCNALPPTADVGKSGG